MHLAGVTAPSVALLPKRQTTQVVPQALSGEVLHHCVGLMQVGLVDGHAWA